MRRDDAWRVRYPLQAVQDQSLLIPAEEAWGECPAAPLRRPGFDVREHLLASLGQAAGIEARVETSLRESAPSGYSLDSSGRSSS